MKDWKKRFKKQILERGWDYYQCGAVVSLVKTENGYEAVVEGSEDYEVEIAISANGIWEPFCSCPYAEDGNACKHMAAVLYQIEQEGAEAEKTNTGKKKDWKQELEETISRIPEKEMRGLLLKIACQDNSLGNRILMEYAEKMDAKQIRQMKKEVDRIANQHADWDGFISYSRAWEYACALMDFLQEKVQVLIDRGYLMEAFELTNHVFLSVGKQEMDDSDGGVAEVADACFACWEQIVQCSKKEQEEQMFRWFMEQYQCCEPDYMREFVESFFMQEFHAPEMLQQKLELLDAVIAKSEKTLAKEESWYLGYFFEENVKRRMQIMKELGCSQKEWKAYLRKYRHLPEVRKLEVEDYLQKKAYDQAICVLQESKALDKALPGLVSEYSQRLMEIYQKTGRNDAYKMELLEYIFNHPQYDLTYIDRLKAECDAEEWQKQRERILTERRLGMIKFQLLAAEGLHERLLQEISASGSIHALDQYEKLLKKHFPEKTRDLYVNYVRNQAVHTANRKEYQSLMRYLKKIVKYPDGKEMAGRIAEEWRQNYKRRSAMMDELKRAGF